MLISVYCEYIIGSKLRIGAMLFGTNFNQESSFHGVAVTDHVLQFRVDFTDLLSRLIIARDLMFEYTRLHPLNFPRMLKQSTMN
jgi:hypothetical protein